MDLIRGTGWGSALQGALAGAFSFAEAGHGAVRDFSRMSHFSIAAVQGHLAPHTALGENHQEE